jgi:hypothetical protein
MADDIERRISRSLLIGTVLTLVFQSGVTIYTIAARAQDKVPITSFSEGIQLVSDATLKTYGSPVITTLLAFTYVAVVLHFFEEQVYKWLCRRSPKKPAKKRGRGRG